VFCINEHLDFRDYITICILPRSSLLSNFGTPDRYVCDILEMIKMKYSIQSGGPDKYPVKGTMLNSICMQTELSCSRIYTYVYIHIHIHKHTYTRGLPPALFAHQPQLSGNKEYFSQLKPDLISFLIRKWETLIAALLCFQFFSATGLKVIEVL